MASQLGIRIGPRLDPCVDNALVVCNERGWIQINFETQTFTITDSGTTKFESIQDAIQDKNDPKQIFSAIKRHIGAPKGLTKPQLLSLHQQTARKLDARIRELELLLAARPRETQMAPKTPLRKAMSLPYPTPVSHPSRPRINFENNLATPPSSPTPQRAPSMDIHLESSPAPPSRFATPIAEEVIEVVPTYDQPTPENEGLRKISELESELAQCKASRAKLEERISDMGDEIRVLKELQPALSSTAVMPPVFQGVKYHLASTLPDDRRDELTGLLTTHGAVQASSISTATHVISDSDTGFEGWQDAKQENVVSDFWVERSIELNKLQEPAFYSVSRSKLFSGVVACSADLDIADDEVISAGIMELGGQWRMGGLLSRDVTHLFAVSTATDKYRTAMTYGKDTHMRVLVPNWFDDSVLFGIPKLDTKTYEWPEPEVLKRRRNSQPMSSSKYKEQQRVTMSPQKRALFTTAVYDPSKPDSQVPASSGKNIWNKQRVLLSTRLQLTGARRQIVERYIKQSNGVPLLFHSNDGKGTDEEELALVASCHIYVTRHRSGHAFFKAWRARKMIGTLPWLLHCQVTGSMSNPRGQLLHFPIPPQHIEGYERQKISVTNYTGPARDYLKKLINLMGGEFTPSLTQKNTILVAADKSGPKTPKAQEWSIPIVNHTWLEDCFDRWKNLTPATDKYITFPIGINFSALLGETPLGDDIDQIIAEEAEKLGELATFDDDDEDQGMADSQASADETEVMGGLLPALDIDMDGGDDDRREGSVEDSPSPSERRSAKKKQVHLGVSSSEDEADPEIMKKVVRIAHPRSPLVKRESGFVVEIATKSPGRARAGTTKYEPVSPAIPRNGVRSAPKKMDTDSEGEASEDADQPVPRKSKLVRRVTGPLALRRSPRKGPPASQMVARESPSPSLSPPRATLNEIAPLESDDDDDDLPERIIRIPRASTPSSSKKQPPKSKTTPRKPVSARTPIDRVCGIADGLETEIPVISFAEDGTGAERISREPPSSAPEPLVAHGIYQRQPIWHPGINHGGGTSWGRAKRTAATQATQRLHDVVMPDVLKHENEKRNWGKNGRRVSGRMDEWDVKDDEENARVGKKRRVSASDAEGSVAAESKARPRKSEPVLRHGKPIKMLLSKVELDDEVLKVLSKLGARVTNNTPECTHLLVPELVRTEKFLSAVAKVPFILDMQWAVKSAEANQLLPEEDYLLSDHAGEQKHNIVLSEVLDRARANGGRLFQGMTFYITSSVKPSPAMLVNIAQANGGQATAPNQLSSRTLGANPNRYIISCPKDETMWAPFEAQGRTVYTPEFILASALRQRIDWDDPAFKLS
ncbi:hypothetical protein FB45DRAFT_1020000 [Roridomyces roridus]|uniref:BRCT domain-containing protein n=1 Tax=Roridomyces roridus TaxID=1738132 RepID=A0AAD7CG16_9AGAR|nr:hypothetical protein FB45DRAFT_1020000 [Roridomyces roridus]